MKPVHDNAATGQGLHFSIAVKHFTVAQQSVAGKTEYAPQPYWYGAIAGNAPYPLPPPDNGPCDQRHWQSEYLIQGERSARKSSARHHCPGPNQDQDNPIQEAHSFGWLAATTRPR